jgi:hypothetical protein
MLTFFNNCADDLEKTIVNLHEVKVRLRCDSGYLFLNANKHDVTQRVG